MQLTSWIGIALGMTLLEISAAGQTSAASSRITETRGTWQSRLQLPDGTSLAMSPASPAMLPTTSPALPGFATALLAAVGAASREDPLIDEQIAVLSARLRPLSVPVLVVIQHPADLANATRRLPLAKRAGVQFTARRGDHPHADHADPFEPQGTHELLICATGELPVWRGKSSADAERIAREVQDGVFVNAYELRRRELMPRLVEALAKSDAAAVHAVAAELLQANRSSAEAWMLELFAMRDLDKKPDDAFVLVNRAAQALADSPRDLHSFLAAGVLAESNASPELIQAALRALKESERRSRMTPALRIDHVRALFALGRVEESRAKARVLAQELGPDPNLQRRLRRAMGAEPPAAAPTELSFYLGSSEASATPMPFGQRFLDVHAMLEDAESGNLVGRLALLHLGGRPSVLNGASWYLAGVEGVGFEGRYARLALEFAEAMTQCDGWRDHANVDTYAAVLFEYGHAAAAVRSQQESIRLGATDPAYTTRLRRYQQAVEQRNAQLASPSRTESQPR